MKIPVQKVTDLWYLGIAAQVEKALNRKVWLKRAGT